MFLNIFGITHPNKEIEKKLIEEAPSIWAAAMYEAYGDEEDASYKFREFLDSYTHKLEEKERV